MKKIIALALALIMLVALVSCGAKTTQAETDTTPQTDATNESATEKEKIDIGVAVMAGPTGMGAAKLMDDSANGNTANNYKFTVASSPDEVTASIISGEFKIACIPTNLAAVLYNKTSGKIKCAAVDTLGVLYVLTNGVEISSVADLAGKTVYATNQGSTPEYILDYVLEKNNLDPAKDVDIQFSDADTVAAGIASGEMQIAVLPEPKVTAATVSGKGSVVTALNLTSEWEKVSGGETTVMQGCIIVNTDFAAQNKDAVDAFLSEYKASVEFVNGDVDTASTYCETYGIIPKAAVAKKAYPNCNITYIDGEEMTTKLTAFLNVLFDADANSVGGKMPGDDFYYTK